jgi:hypothetical protein
MRRRVVVDVVGAINTTSGLLLLWCKLSVGRHADMKE